MQNITKLNRSLYLFLLVAIILCAFFPGLGKGSLWDRDETAYAQVAHEMLQENTWTVPFFNGEAFLHKPVFAYCMIRVAYHIFGENEFSARFFSAVFGLATCIMTFFLGELLYDSWLGFLSGLILATSMMPLVVFRAAVTDAYLVFFITGSLYFFLKAGYAKRKGFYYISYVMMGLGTMVKGPIGFVLPAGIIFFYLLFSKNLGMIKEIRPWHGLGILLLVVSPWFLKIYSMMGDKFVSDFIMKHHVERFSQSMGGHRGPFWTYVPVVLLGFFPWSVFSIQSYKTFKSFNPQMSRFLLVWCGVVFVLFSLASTKLPHYVLPLFPALAIFFGWFWHRVFSSEEAEAAESGSLITSFRVIFVIGILLVVASLVFYFIYPEMASYRLVLNMLIIAGGGWFALRMARMKKIRAAFWTLPSMLVVFVFFASHISVPWVENFRTVIPLAKEVGVLSGERDKIYAYGFFEPGLVYYSGRRVEKIDSFDPINKDRDDRFFLFIRKKDFKREKITSPLYHIAEKNGINEVKGNLHLMVLSNKPGKSVN